MSEGRRSLLLALVALAAVGCGSTDRSALDAPDAATPAPDPASTPPWRAARARAIVTSLRAIPRLRDEMAPSTRLLRVDGGFRLDPASPPVVRAGWSVVGAPTIEATLPARAGASMTIAPAGDVAHGIDVRAIDLRDAEAEPIDGNVVYADAAEGVDVVRYAQRGRVEELRVFASSGESHARYELRAHSAIASVRARAGRIEALDEQGRVRIASDPLWAVDANGTRRTPTLALANDGDRWLVDVALDARGLVAPIVLDPGWESAYAGQSTNHDWGAAGILPDGRVIAAGGGQGGTYSYNGAEIWDPASNSWSGVAGMSTNRGATAGSTTGDGKLVVMGGTNNSTYGYALSTGEWFDGGAWHGLSQAYGMRYPAAIPIHATGKVLVGGGENTATPGTVQSMYAFDSSCNCLTGAGVMKVARTRFTLVELPGGKAAAIGGYQVASIETWDGGSGWTLLAPGLSGKRAFAAAALASNGKVIVAGGDMPAPGDIYGAGSPSNTTDIWDTNAGTVVPGPTMVGAREGATASVLPTGKILIAGGGASSEIWDPITNTLSDGGYGGDNHAVAINLNDGRILVVGGSSQLFSQVGNGNACSADYECTSGHCVDGYCCDSACGGQCQACDVGGSIGTCSAVTGAPHGARTSCGAYLCASGACATSCSSNATCASDSFCSGGACVGKQANGATCAADADCTSGHCVDGVCCDVACTGQCEACDGTGTVGTCSPAVGAPHGTRAACGGATTDPMCENRCDGTDRTACHYPTVTTACSKNSCANGEETHASFCDGAGGCNDIAKKCGAYACDVKSCKSSCTADADCASGFVCALSACVPGQPVETGGGIGDPCDATTKLCAKGLSCVDGKCAASCSDSQPCIAGFICVSGNCYEKSKTNHCSDDGLSTIDANGVADACAPYRCRPDGICFPSCNSTSDCAPGATCDTSTKTCVGAGGDAGSSGGCAVGATGGVGGSGVIALMGALVGTSAIARRRRVRRR